jgi:hypothetical protein
MDKRYTIEKEFTGAPCMMFVARFCGQYIGSAKTELEARKLAKKHNAERMAPHSKNRVIEI